MSALPLIGASPDGLVNTDPGSANNTESLLECKTKAPFLKYNSSKWHWLQKPSPDAKITAEHFSQVQMQMLAIGKSCAHLVSWSCADANIFGIEVDYEWLTAALQLLCTVQKQ